jgi:hypothetical protein
MFFFCKSNHLNQSMNITNRIKCNKIHYSTLQTKLINVIKFSKSNTKKTHIVISSSTSSAVEVQFAADTVEPTKRGETTTGAVRRPDY